MPKPALFVRVVLGGVAFLGGVAVLALLPQEAHGRARIPSTGLASDPSPHDRRCGSEIRPQNQLLALALVCQ